MLILTRRIGESLVIGEDVKVVVLDVMGHQVRVGIEAPASVNVRRSELPESPPKRQEGLQAHRRPWQGCSDGHTLEWNYFFRRRFLFFP